MKSVRHMTPEENKIVDLLADAWNAFIHLPILHQKDQDEFIHAIHQAQNIIMSRPIFEDINRP